MLQVRDWVMQRVYELLRSWWLERVEKREEEESEKRNIINF